MNKFTAPSLIYYLLLGRKYIVLTLLFGLFLNAVSFNGRVGVPDFAGLVLLFWNIFQPRIVGLISSFLFGLIVDVQSGFVLGQNAFVYTLQAFIAISLHHRITWFGVGVQVLHIFPILLLSQIFELGLNLILGSAYPGMWFFLSSVVGAVVWPILSFVLTWPRRYIFRRRSYQMSNL